MTLGTLPCFRLGTTVLANWLRSWPGTWWTVDGDDRLLSERLWMPCSAEELAERLDSIQRDLLLVDDGYVVVSAWPVGSVRDADELDRIDPRDTSGGRSMTLCWDDADRQLWMLYEDLQSAELYESSIKLDATNDSHAAPTD